MIWHDLATWRGPTPNQGGAMTAYRGVVLHIAEGTFEGTISWCRNSSADVSAHFVVARDGRIAQLVDTDVQSWCQSAGNAEWLSIENEGYGGQALTAAQVAACARILARAHQVHGVPLQAADSPSGRGLGHHSMGGAAWGGHYQCPGTLIINQKVEIIRQAGGQAGGGDVALTEHQAHMLENTGYRELAWALMTPDMDGSLKGYRHKGVETLAAIRDDVAAIRAGTPVQIALTPELADAVAAKVADVVGVRLAELEARVDRIADAVVAAGRVAGGAA